MRLNDMTPALVEDLKEKFKFLEEQSFTNIFQNPNFPHLNSLISGSVENQSFPTWYTQIQDILEHAVVEYDKDDIEAGRFLEMKLVLLPNSLEVYFYLPDAETPAIKVIFAAEVSDIEKGSFQFKSPIISELQLNRS